MNQPDQRAASGELLDTIIADVLRRRDAHEQVDIESLCLAHPDLADALRSHFEGEQLLQAMAAESVESHDDTDPSQAQETVRPGVARRTDVDPSRPFGRYHIVRQLGEGAMGAVYLAEDKHLGRFVALKLPKLSGLDGSEFMQRFYREARAAAALRHANLCQVYDADELEETPYITMEYISGQPLSRFVGTDDYRDPRRVATVLRDVALGLEHAHQNGVLHRDLKPGNILIRDDGSPCVTDFGLARRVDHTEESRITMEGTILGTPAYMPPEQIEGKPEYIGPAVDIYALGVILYELLTGQLPFRGSLRSIISQALTKPPEHPVKLRADVDEELADLCMQMLEKRSDNRPASMKAVADQLDHWLENHSPQSAARRQQAESMQDKLKAHKQKILDLTRRGQFAAAMTGLEKLAAATSPEAAEYREWAKQKLPEIQALPQKMRDNVPALVATSQKLLKRHDYAQAAELLTQIPIDFRSEQVQKLLDHAIDLQDEADLLLADLQECVRKKQYEGIEDNLKRLLKLKPGNRFARDLHETLSSYRRVPGNQKTYKFDTKGNLLPYTRDNSWMIWTASAAMTLLVVFGIAYQFITIYLKSNNRTLAVQVNKAWLDEQGGNLSLTVDGDKHTISGPDFSVTVALGEHGFSVTNGNTVIHAPQRFEIVKSDSSILVIDASGMHLDAADPPPAPKPVVTSLDSSASPSKDITNDPFAGQKLQARWSKNFLGTSFLWIPGGKFRMGSVQETPDESDERPVDVEISHGLWVQQHELTQGEWRKLVGLTPWMPFTDKQANDRNAATHMTWDESVDYCQRLTDRDRRLGNIPMDWEYRLPSEAEWEYFCRAGTRTTYCYGDDATKLGDYAWWKENTQDKGDGYAHEVGQLLPNAWGLHDVHGNVYEFCYDSYLDHLPGGIDPVVASPPIAGKVARGGGWAYVGADALECSDRAEFARNVRRNRVGIRLVLAPVSAISTVGYREELARPATPAGPQKVIDADSWYVVPPESASDWKFSEGTLTAVAGRHMSMAYFNETYDEYELTMEVRFTDPSNGGVYLRAREPHATFQNVFEVDLQGVDDRTVSASGQFSNGGIYLSDEFQPPTDPGGDRDWTHSHGFLAETNAFRTGEWNQVKIRLVDQLLTVEINDQLTFWRLLDDLAIAFPSFADVVARRSGHIGLQAFLGTAQYRNIRIQPLRVH